MNTNYFVAGVLAYVVPTFAIAAPWHLKVFKPVYDRLEVYRETVVMPLGLAAMFLQAIVYTWLYAALFASEAVLIGGLKLALLTGVLGFSYSVLPVAAKHRMRSVAGFIRIETAFTVVQYLVVGPAIALAYALTHTT